MGAFLISTGTIALAEFGDKTQLLTFIFAAQFKKPLPIILGITVATLLNHCLAAVLGIWITTVINPGVLRWTTGLLFLIIAVWILTADKMDVINTEQMNYSRIFPMTFITFFLAEMGDKTQIATVALCTHYSTPITIILGTTLGVLLVDVPAVFLGSRYTPKIPVKVLHLISSLVFMIIGLCTLGVLG